jgi:hypothetical protein
VKLALVQGVPRSPSGRERTDENFRLTPCRNAGRITAMQPDAFEDAKSLWKMFCAGQRFKQAWAAVEHVLKEKQEREPTTWTLM